MYRDRLLGMRVRASSVRHHQYMRHCPLCSIYAGRRGAHLDAPITGRIAAMYEQFNRGMRHCRVCVEWRYQIA
jgi:hypothetical protein